MKKTKESKFRVVRIEYSKFNNVFYYAQIKIRSKLNDSEWQNLYGHGEYKDGYFVKWNVLNWSPVSEGTPFSSEKQALEFIEEYKNHQENKIKQIPIMNEFMRYYEKLKIERQKKIESEIQNNKSKITYREL